ncbi:MAG TPA: hypothetical protein VHK91_14860, partial [Flavisolibacter sp.]|nr:hypothetical protein [Flavisolibacter sp.]
MKSIRHTAALLGLLALTTFCRAQNDTGEEKEKKIKITEKVIKDSKDRRKAKGNNTGYLLPGGEIDPGVNYISGPSSAVRGSVYTFYYYGNLEAGTYWTVSCGQVVEYYDDFITVFFNDYTCTSAVIRVYDQNNARLASKTVTLSGGPPAPLSPGTIQTGIQTLPYGSIPAALSTAAATGGNCFSYQYQWQFSYDNVNFEDIELENSQDLV